ncbi:MAG: superinfection immunity protein [Jatrophihabitans sp.]
MTGPVVHHPAQYGAGGLVGTDQDTNSAEVVIAWVLTVLTLGYLLPWAIAASRGKSNSLAVGLINFLLGWTVIGWIVSLVMACGAHQQRMAVVQMVNVPHYYPPQH